MPLVPTEVIRVGDYYYVDEATGLPKKLRVTPDLIRYWHDTGNEMIGTGLSIPVPLEHQLDHRPQTPAEKSANQLLHNAGWVKNYAIDDKGVLQSVVDIPDPAIAEKLPKTIRFTSPWFSSFTDGNGRKWNGVISHLALTSRPRITKQEPFGELSAAMSYATAIPPARVDFQSLPESNSVTLSRAGLLVPGEGATLVPAYPVAFSLWSGARLALEDLKKDKKPSRKDDGGTPGTEPSPRKHDEPSGPTVPPGDPAKPPSDLDKPPTDPAQTGMLPGAERSLIDADGDISVYDVLCDLLDSIGMPLPEGTDKTNFLERIYTSAMDRIKGMGATPAPDPAAAAGKAPVTPAANPIMQESPPMYMSLEKIATITDPAVREMATAMLSMQTDAEAAKKRASALEQNTLTAARVRRDRRIEALARNMPASARDQLVKMAEGAKLSLGDDGNVVDPLEATLALLESTAKQLPK